MRLLLRILVLVALIVVCFNARAATTSDVRKFVVNVRIDRENASGMYTTVSSGSAIKLAPGFVLTAGHVVKSATSSSYIHLTPEKISNAVVVKFDEKTDVALLFDPVIECPCALLAEEDPSIDTAVYEVGYPLSRAEPIQFLTTGSVQGKYASGKLVSSAQSAPGSSGAGLFAYQHNRFELVGMVNAISYYDEIVDRHIQQQMFSWMTISTPVSMIKTFLRGTQIEQK